MTLRARHVMQFTKLIFMVWPVKWNSLLVLEDIIIPLKLNLENDLVFTWILHNHAQFDLQKHSITKHSKTKQYLPKVLLQSTTKEPNIIMKDQRTGNNTVITFTQGCQTLLK